MLYLTIMQGEFLDLTGIEIEIEWLQRGMELVFPSIFFTVLCPIMAWSLIPSALAVTSPIIFRW